MIAARNTLGPPGPRSQPTPVLTEQAWLDWAVLDLRYQVEAFKSSTMLAATWTGWHLPAIAPLSQPVPPSAEPEAGEQEPAG